MLRLRRFWLKMSLLGVTSELTLGLAKKVTLSNQLGLSLALISVPCIFIFGALGSPLLGAMILLPVLGNLLVLIANYFGFYTLSRVLLVLVGNATVAGYAIACGPDAGTNIYYLALLSFPVVLFKSDEIKPMVWSLFLPAVVEVFLYLKGYSYSPLLLLDATQLSIINVCIICLTAFSISSALSYLYMLYANSETILLENINNLKKEIIARKEAEALLSTNESRLKTMFDSASDAIFILDRDFRYVSLNKACEKYSGPIEAAVGKTVFELMGQDLGQHFADKYKQVFMGKKTILIEEEIFLPTGITLFLSTILSPIFSPTGKVDQIIGITRDVSDYKSTLKQLGEAKKQAEMANLAKSQFLANMSHEIRTPMGIILGFSEILNGATNLESNHKKALEHIQRNGRHLIKLIDEILDLSKIEAGQLKICSAPLIVREEINKAVAPLVPSAGKKNITIKCEYESDVPEYITTDSLRFRQIILNVLSNAIKYSDGGEITILTSMCKEPGVPQGELVQISVRDQGIGISQDDRRVLFKPFLQGQSATHQCRGGAGLGLNLARKLARALGGDLKLMSSVLGRGSEFRIHVRAELSRPLAAEAKIGSNESWSYQFLKTGTLSNKTVLVVEDNLDNQALIRTILESDGAEVIMANNGRAGIEEALTVRPDIVLMDLQLPVLTGLEATSKLRKSGFSAPIVALTANAMAGEREKCLTAGCNEYLTKPINRGLLSETILKLLSNSK